MSTSAPPAPAGIPLTDPAAYEPLPGELAAFADDLRAFYHALPELLADEDTGQYAVVAGGRVHGTWDTVRDADQFGLIMFPDGRYLIQPVDPRYLDVLPRHFGPLPHAEEG